MAKLQEKRNAKMLFFTHSNGVLFAFGRWRGLLMAKHLLKNQYILLYE